MRLSHFLLGVVLAASALHCSKDEAAEAAPEEQIVENKPGALVVTSPARGAFIEAVGPGTIDVSGTGATPALVINGAKAKVADDGSFHAQVKLTPGLNLINAVDGESRLDTPVLYGKFASPDVPVAEAVSLDIGPGGISAALPAASLESVGNTFLASRDLVAGLKGKTFSGSNFGVDWTYKVTKAGYASAKVALTPSSQSLVVGATVTKISVEGTLSMEFLGKTHTGPTTITAEKATVKGDAQITLDKDKGELGAAMPKADANLEGFKYSSGNAGFPCCVDSIMTSILEGKIESAVSDAIRTETPNLLKTTLAGTALPKQIDLTKFGIDPIAIDSKFDGASLDTSGASLTVALGFTGAGKGTAPGYFKLGGTRTAGPTPASIGVSISLDAVNQLAVAAGGGGTSVKDLPDVASLKGGKVTPSMPPVVTVSDAGGLTLGLGEVIVSGTLADHPMKAGVSIIQELTPTTEDKALVLAPKGQPKLSISWLVADDIPESVRSIIAAAANEQLGKFLKPIRVPIPSVNLEKLGPGFQGQFLTVGSPTIAVDGKAARIDLAGTMTLSK